MLPRRARLVAVETQDVVQRWEIQLHRPCSVKVFSDQVDVSQFYIIFTELSYFHPPLATGPRVALHFNPYEFEFILNAFEAEYGRFTSLLNGVRVLKMQPLLRVFKEGFCPIMMKRDVSNELSVAQMH